MAGKQVMPGRRLSGHKWTFYRAGGIDQALLCNGTDIAHLAELDQKLWTVLSCPTKGLYFDVKTLELLDSDKDGRVRVPEILSAISWLKARLASLDSLIPGSDTLPLAAINTETAEGKALLISAKRTLANLGKPKAEAITLADVTDKAAIFAKTRFNGDGVIPAEATDDAATKALIADISATQGTLADLTGKLGVNQAKVDAFFASATAFVAWSGLADTNKAILPLGDKTAAAAAALHVVQAKVDDYFTRCRLAAFDGRATAPLNRADSDYAVLAGERLDDHEAALDGFPLARIEPDSDLPLQGSGINPYWAKDMAVFHATVAAPLLGDAVDTLSAAQWQTIKGALAPYAGWQATKTGNDVAGLGVARLDALIAGDVRDKLNALIASDLALAPENAKIDELGRLLRYHANFVALLDNYVNMSQLYDPRARAMFQIGTLYMDARACNLCFHVDDVAAHAAQAVAGKCCLAYCVINRPGAHETRHICAVFTAGFARTLWVGRNGIFYDRDGRDWEAVIVKMQDNPISLKEAFWDPWRKIADMIGNQVKKMLASKNEAVLSGAGKKIETVGAVPIGDPPPEVPKKMEGALFASSVAAIGIAVGIVGSAFGGIISLVAGLPLWKTALGVVAVLLMVSGPSVVLTWFKLRARDLAPILNACGWAINRRLYMSLKLGSLFTTEATLPAGAERQLTDPYADDHSARVRVAVALIIILLVVTLWLIGLLNTSWMPQMLHRPFMFG